MTEYFSNYPLVDYAGKTMRNLVLRADIASSVIKKYGVFYPYRVRDEDRPDTVAFDYYGSSDFFWLVLASNDMVDPYHDWPLSDADFEAYVLAKYGTRETALSTVHHYESATTDRWVYPDTRDNLPPEFLVGFDTEVTAYSWEKSLNEDKKTINLLSKRYARRAEAELRGALLGRRE